MTDFDKKMMDWAEKMSLELLHDQEIHDHLGKLLDMTEFPAAVGDMVGAWDHVDHDRMRNDCLSMACSVFMLGMVTNKSLAMAVRKEQLTKVIRKWVTETGVPGLTEQAIQALVYELMTELELNTDTFQKPFTGSR